jgi:hypothetical protein
MARKDMRSAEILFEHGADNGIETILTYHLLFHYIITKGMKTRTWISCPIENYHGKLIYRKSFHIAS